MIASQGYNRNNSVKSFSQREGIQNQQPLREEDILLDAENLSESIQGQEQEIVGEVLAKIIPARSQEELNNSIVRSQQSIKLKTKSGMALSKIISSQTKPDYFLKLQRYEIFVNKMNDLYRNEMKFKRKLKLKLKEMLSASSYSDQALKEILKNYNTLSHRGFDSNMINKSLHIILQTLLSRGNYPKILSDYSFGEMEESWRFNKVIDDIKFGLKDDQEFSAHHLGSIAQTLGEMGYKNTNLIEMQLKKIEQQLDIQKRGGIQERDFTQLTIEQEIYGAAKNFLPKHYIYQGFQNNQEFKEYVDILLQWEQEGNKVAKTKEHKQIEDFEQAMKQLIESSFELRKFQEEEQLAIESLRDQYYKMLEARDKYAFLEQNPYILNDFEEVQEIFVNSGMINPNEINAYSEYKNQSFQDKMGRASQIFYDFVLNYNNEMISPQYEKFYKASQVAQKIINEDKIKENVKADHVMKNVQEQTAESLSTAIIGIGKQALSFRLDTERRDYLNQFYKEMMNPADKNITSNELFDMKRIYQYVDMEREYLKGWTTFQNHIQNINSDFEAILWKENKNLGGLLHGLLAMTYTKMYNQELIDKVISESIQLSKAASKHFEQSAVVNGLMGLGLTNKKDLNQPNLNELIELLIKDLEPAQLNFQQQIDALWSLCLLKQYNNSKIEVLSKIMSDYQFERVGHDLRYQEFIKLADVYKALEVEAKHLMINNKDLTSSIKDEGFAPIEYEEARDLYDPFKERVVQGITKGLTSASVNHQLLLKDSLKNQQDLEMFSLSPHKFPYKPDILMGYQGQKVGVFVLPEKSIYVNALIQTGYEDFKARLIQKAHKNEQISSVFIPIQKIISYDIAAFKINFNENFNLSEEFQKQLHTNQDNSLSQKFLEINAFSQNLMTDLFQFSQSLKIESHQQKLELFVAQIYKIFHLKHNTDLLYNKHQIQAGYQDIKINLMKFNFLYEELPIICQEYVKSFVPTQFNSFKDMVLNLNKKLKIKDIKEQQPPLLKKDWQGKRYEVEIPNQSESLRKSIVPELLNQRFMWVDNYFHYKDWEEKQLLVFDNFNLLQIPQNKNQHKFFFDIQNHCRRVPQGIFPLPNQKREIILPKVQEFNSIVQQNRTLSEDGKNNELVMFEKEPLKMMVIGQLEKGVELQPLDNEVSLITNLQNIKQGLKSDYNDAEILKMILLNLTFTDNLIEEHLSKLKDIKKAFKEVKYLPRNPSMFRDFVLSTYHSKDREDPFTHFFLKESGKQERIEQLQKQMDQLSKEEQHAKSHDELTELQQKQEELSDKIDKMLIQNEMENNDIHNLSNQLKNTLNVKYDLQSLMKNDFFYDVDEDIKDKNISDVEFLQIQRRKAETKLIKSKIVYKCYEGLTLNDKEKKYLKAWLSDLQENEERNFFNLKNSMLTSTPTSFTFKDIESKCLYSLNSIAKVKFDNELHGHYSLNELILELGHFLDGDVVEKVERNFVIQKLNKEWEMFSSQDKIQEIYSIGESKQRNKEPKLLQNFYEEYLFRYSGKFLETDFNKLLQMWSVKRGKDSFDKEYWPQDQQSLKEFMLSDCNDWDSRVKLLEEWVVRKEEEINVRANLPAEQYKKTDQELNILIDKPLKKARESIVAQLLQQDEFGNEMKIKKKYEEMTSKELNRIVESLAVRFYLFNYEYPSFLPQLVKAVMEHPNLLNSDKTLLNFYCKIFEVDWTNEKQAILMNDFMSNCPIYLGKGRIGDNIKAFVEEMPKDKRQMFDQMSQRVKNSCGDYVTEATSKMTSQLQ